MPETSGIKQESLTALLVLPSGARRRALMDYLKSLDITTTAVDTCRQARARIKANPTVDIVITQASLTDGNWCDVLGYTVVGGAQTRVVVSSSVADERFWSEVLWRGVYDVLVEPYDSSEVRRIVDGVLRSLHPRVQATSVSAASGARATRLGGDSSGGNDARKPAAH